MNENFYQPSNITISYEEWQDILKAIIARKYSWACVLILHSLGYNPLKYISYRTYIRLIKNNFILGNINNHKTAQINLNDFNIEIKENQIDNN
ncbi:HetP family heterocyst commitment protein [Halotia branconii]|uniref:HetP family heterocyst commitment protein n=1 Tax=Halotia branconii CENA392 TaxID=1539056 RepID=A0AAJ6P851_9CYAN|nr:HetP family heterocyst commitment protein [Halotia branconii]WGV24311.1 HetP family heterocyst commitment protein [Halotia branconii CENA392]